MVRLELHRSADPGQPYYVILRSVGNGKILFWTETYTSRQGAINAGQILLNNGLKADFIDQAAA